MWKKSLWQKKERFSNLYKHSTSLAPPTEKVIEKLRSPERPTFTIGSPTTSTFDRTGSYLAEMHAKTVSTSGNTQTPSNKANECVDPLSDSRSKSPHTPTTKLTGSKSNVDSIASASAPIYGMANNENGDFVDSSVKPKDTNGIESVSKENVERDNNLYERDEVLNNKTGDFNKSDCSKLKQLSDDDKRPTFHIVSSDECLTPPQQKSSTSEKSGNYVELSSNVKGNLQPGDFKTQHFNSVEVVQNHVGNTATTSKSSPKSVKLDLKSHLHSSTLNRHEPPKRKKFSDITGLAKHTVDALLEQSGGRRILNSSGNSARCAVDVSFSRAVSVGGNTSVPRRKDGRYGGSDLAKSVPHVAIVVPVDVTDATNTTSEPLTVAAEAIDVVEELTANKERKSSISVDINDVPEPEVTDKQAQNYQNLNAAGGSSRQKAKISRQEQPNVPIFQPLSIFTPKRKVHAPSMNSIVKMDEVEVKNKEPLAPLITTEFIPWCSKRVSEPLLDIIERRVGDGLNDNLCNRKLPSDWAYYKREILLQNAEQEHHVLENTPTVQCDSQLFFLKPEKPVTSLAWSFLRPHIYTCDGRNFDIWRYEVQKTPEIKRRIDCTDNNPYCSDVVCQVEAINDLTRELIIMGSADSLMRIWDPGYSIFSNEFEKEQRLVTAAYLLKDEPRLGDGLKTVYRDGVNEKDVLLYPETLVYADFGMLLQRGNFKILELFHE